MSTHQPPLRHVSFDRARGLAALLVIVLHAGRYARPYLSQPEWLATFNTAAAPFRMPLLMLVAGLFVDRALRKGASNLLQIKLRQLLWPFLVWIILVSVVTGAPEQLLSVKAWRGGTYLWFLQFLFAYITVAVLLRRVPHLAVASVALAISIAAEDGTRYGERLFVLMAYFFVGAFLGRHLERFTALLADRRMLLLAPCLILISFASVHTGNVRYNPLWFVLVVPALICLLAVLQQLPASLPLRGLEFMGRTSIVYYLVNSIVYQVANPVLNASGVSGQALVGISLTLVLAVATLLAHLRRRNRALAVLFEFPDTHGRASRAATQTDH